MRIASDLTKLPSDDFFNLVSAFVDKAFE